MSLAPIFWISHIFILNTFKLFIHFIVCSFLKHFCLVPYIHNEHFSCKLNNLKYNPYKCWYLRYSVLFSSFLLIHCRYWSVLYNILFVFFVYLVVYLYRQNQHFFYLLLLYFCCWSHSNCVADPNYFNLDPDPFATFR